MLHEALSQKRQKNETSKCQTSVFSRKAKATSTINVAFCSFPPSVGKKLMPGFCQFIPGLKSTPEEKKTKPISYISPRSAQTRRSRGLHKSDHAAAPVQFQKLNLTVSFI